MCYGVDSLGGRNYETYSGGPLVLGLLAAAYVSGRQGEGIVATPKHFVANVAEDERTRRRSSYNKVNQEYVSDSKRLIDEVLRKEWGFKGLVMSDWMGIYSTARGLETGQDLEMPGPTKWRSVGEVKEQIRTGAVTEETINTSARRVLELARRLGLWDNPEEPPERCVEDPATNALIRDAGAEGITLLRNEGGVLPIPKTATVAIIGQHATSVVLSGGGSARVDAQHAITLVDGLQKLAGDQAQPESFYFYKRQLERRFTHEMTAGRRYSVRMDSWAADRAILDAPPLNGKMFQGSAVRFYEHIDLAARLREASEAAAACDYAVVCTGTINEIESEGFDQTDMDVTAAEYDMVDAVLAAKPDRSAVVNFSGAPVGMAQFTDRSPAIVQAKVEDNPVYDNFPSHNNILRYEEALNVGYRYYDRADVAAKPLFPFGYGLSYTTFAVLGAAITQQRVLFAAADANIGITVTARVQNTGGRAGKVAVQFYVADCNSGDAAIGGGGGGGGGHARPPKELRAFEKVALEAGEVRDVVLTLDRDCVSFYDAARMCWEARPGVYKVLVGLSSVDITHSVDFTVDKGFTWTGV
ncbi:glycoside hydrolase superfamily [Microdochium bolleyi]|uniref:beta-glucosidase n=1 Tax=Microdochium bolleyi TaxID=196109 RepID=A0A136IIQ5_9PEZI|nr:glycoside hydrolase superfamily [Microdochium bolleyi]